MNPERLPRGLRPFAHRPFRLVWTGQAISLLGTWVQTVAQAWLVLELTGDPLALGIVGAAQFAPVLALGLFGGVVADAIPKRRGFLVTQAASLVLAAALAVLTLAGIVEVWQVVVLALLLGVVTAFDMPIRQAFVVEMVGREEVVSAVGLNSALFNGTRILGPAVAGLLIAAVGVAACFVINALSYVAIIAALLLVRPGELRPSPVSHVERTARSVMRHLAEGLRYVRATSTVLLAVSVVGVVSTAALNLQVVLPLVSRDLLSGGPETYGFLAAASGVGSLASALSLAFRGRPTMGRVLGGAALVGVATVALAFSVWLSVSLILMGVVGWGLIAMAATTNTIIQLATPDELRGRVMSVYTTVFAGSAPAGNLVTGALAAWAGVAVALVVGGSVALGFAAAATVWAGRHLRVDLRRVPARADGRAR